MCVHMGQLSAIKEWFFSEPTLHRQVAKYGNLKRCESLPFSGDIESLEPSNFDLTDC